MLMENKVDLSFDVPIVKGRKKVSESLVGQTKNGKIGEDKHIWKVFNVDYVYLGHVVLVKDYEIIEGRNDVCGINDNVYFTYSSAMYNKRI